MFNLIPWNKRILFIISVLFISLSSPPSVFSDTTGPASVAYPTPQEPNGDNGWYKTPVDLLIAATDLQSGVKNIRWRVGEGVFYDVEFSNTLNLVDNPSFEDTSEPPVTSWDFSGQPGSLGIVDNAVYRFDNSSVMVSSYQNGWSGFNNSSSYIPTIPFSNMNLSFWLKTENVIGNGVYVKVYTLDPAGETLIGQSQSIVGTNDWVRINYNFYVSVNDSYGVYVDLGIDGVGSVWFDGVSISASVYDTSLNQTFSQNGNYTIEYYAIDNDLNEETPHQTFDLKVDTVSPSTWRNFNTEISGNNHTLISEITVDDASSGIDSNEGYFQYSVDGGTTWGYFSDLISCNSTWITDGWKNLSTSIINNNHTAVLETPVVDYCNSDWAVCKIIRFKTSDIASNESSKDVCINGSWFISQGDVGSRYGIIMSSSGPSDNNDGAIYSAGSIANFTSSKGYYIESYPLPENIKYIEWLVQYPTSTPLPSGKLPTISGLFINNGSFTISNNTIPTGFSNSIFSSIVYIDGDLIINDNFSINNESTLVFIVSGDVNIDKNVNEISGFFLIDGEIDTSYNGNSGNTLVVRGSFISKVTIINRSLKGKGNENNPTLEIIYEPKYLTKSTLLMGNGEVSWREISL